MSARTGITVRLISLVAVLGGCTFGGSPKPTVSPQFTSGSMVIWADSRALLRCGKGRHG